MLTLIRGATYMPPGEVEARLAGLDHLFDQVAVESQIPKEMLQAVAIVESRVNPTAENPESPAFGLMQIWGPEHFGEPHALPRGPTTIIDRSNWQIPLVNLRAGASTLVSFGALNGTVSWWETLNDYNGDEPPRDPEYERDVYTRYIGLLRRRLFT